MTIETYEPNAHEPEPYDPAAPAEVSMTDAAIAHVRKQLAKNPDMAGIRLGVKKSGCSGFKYDFSFDSKIDNNDLKHENIVIDKSSLDMLKGSQVDFTNELIGSSFKISNPKTKSSCGCGVSFSF